MKNLKSKTPFLFYILAAAIEIASAKGIYSYMMLETKEDMLMSAVAAVSIAFALYSCWNIAFSQRGIVKRIISLLIALSLACLSTYTLYQSTLLPSKIILAKELKSDQQRKNKAERSSLEIISSLLQQSKDDANRIENLRSGKQSWKTRQELKKITADLDKRNLQMINLQQQATNNSQESRQIKSSHADLNFAALARSSIYSFGVALFLLLASWHRQENPSAKKPAKKPAKKQSYKKHGFTEKNTFSDGGQTLSPSVILDLMNDGENFIATKALADFSGKTAIQVGKMLTKEYGLSSTRVQVNGSQKRGYLRSTLVKKTIKAVA